MTEGDARIGGIHHVTAVAGDPQENLDFYTGVLGMRLVKRSVNQDDPGTYHLFYADGEGHPGTDLTFFPFAEGSPGRNGHGLTTEVALAVPPESLDYWRDRLEDQGVEAARVERFGEDTLTFADFHGLQLALVAAPRADERPFTAWDRSPVPEEHQVRGIHAVRLLEQDAAPTVQFATDTLGMERVSTEDGWTRFRGRDDWSGYLEVREDVDAPRGSVGVGQVHHVAWRVEDDEEHKAMQRAVEAAGLRPTTIIDRFWFRSIYFREPGNALFEIATDGPGFLVDEQFEGLGERLTLAPWLEEHRERIEASLPRLRMPHEREVRAEGASSR